ncbi:MAG: type IV-A pilus assembly ATPase PilB [Methylomonas sp.]|nr:MAG: type IV-A pilus assembly ATPase PilB [Methylomonas sp.]PPD26985.1 MAG: type IV-A pilus assembly ATPase PilB [Methylomonas sp.]PPD38924.1 MAG: type IV-A pilus assembly ATPase PilB [Methylomonas sp.]PPD42592.1 MAG: type IV-A pilus assembly ATPase PilB [Methylomonas sp.]PPD54136.1 MAG: type IV-A pilus assembly ATPase PilB [Methylomonas sp.]
MATAPSNIFSGLAKCLIQEGLLTEDMAVNAQQEAQKQIQPFISYLVNNKLVDSRTVAALASREFGVPLLDLDAVDLAAVPVKLVSEKLIRQHHALPLFKRGNRLFVAMADPTHFQTLDEIKFHTRLSTESILVEEDKLRKTIDAALEAVDTSMTNLLDADLDKIGFADEGERQNEDVVTSDIDDAPIVRFVNKILLDSIKKGVSDIHLEPFEKKFRIRFRADGILSEIASPPIAIAGRIISRIKVMSKMDIAERRVPQDGRIKMQISKHRAIDFRVNSCPTLFGEKVVMRILDPTSAQIGIEKLGFEPAQQKCFLNAIHKPYGMVLVTGPTGSGKTVSLYTGLNLLNSIERNISTAEDPVEITVEGINQVNVNPKAGLTFAEALRAFLRQDPDIIMVGEIRDLETASIAVKAAQTGHLVLSTLHTNDAPQTINRLVQMGIEPFNIVSAVNLIMAQRLARRLCEHCKQEADFPANVWLAAGFAEQDIGTFPIYEAVGCEHCNHGYKGRVGIYQVLPISEKMRALILRGGNAMEMAELAKTEGINDLRASGLLKVRQGITSLEEIDRVTKE